MSDTANDLVNVDFDSYNIQEKWLSDIAPKYLDIDDINHLNVGLFGYINEVMATEVRTSVAHRNFLYDEAFLNTASMTKSIYNKAKSYNYDISMATPASCEITFSITQSSVEALGEKQYDELTGAFSGIYKLTLSQDNLFYLDDYQFMAEADIIIQEKRIVNASNTSVSYSYTAMYDYSNNNGAGIFSGNTNPYITTWVTRSNALDNNVISMNLTVYQAYKSTTVFENFSSDLSDNLFFDISYKNHLCQFITRYETQKIDVILAKYFNDAFTPDDDYYHYYTFDGEKLTVFFSGLPENFKPAINSKLTVDVYTTLGTTGNFNFEGTPTYNFSNLSSQSTVQYFIELKTNPKGGSDAPSKKEIKQDLIYEFLTRDNLVTEFDLNQYFNKLIKENVVNSSSILFVKKRDDIMQRCYAAYLLLRDKSGLVIPTNTVDIDYICDIQKAFRIEAGTEIVYDDNNYIIYNTLAERLIADINTLEDNSIKIYEFYGDSNTYLLENDVIDYMGEDEYYKIKDQLTISGVGIYTILDTSKVVSSTDEDNSSEELTGTESDYYTTLDDDNLDSSETTRDYDLQYKLPFSIYYQLEPFPRLLIVKSLIDEDLYFEFNYANSNINSEFVIDNMSILRNPISFNRVLSTETETYDDADMNMTITHRTVTITNGITETVKDIYYDEDDNIVKQNSVVDIAQDKYHIKKYTLSFVLQTTLATSIIESTNPTLFIVRALIKSDDTYQGYFDFEVNSLDSSNVTLNATLETNDNLDTYNRLCLVNSVYGLNTENSGQLLEEFYLDEESDLEICILIADDTSNYDAILPSPLSDLTDLEGFTLAARFNNTGRKFRLFRVINDIVQPSFDYRPSEYMDAGIIMQSLPVIGSHYLSDFEVFRSFYETFNTYYEVLESNFNKLENNTGVDIKFYNTFGFSKYFSSYSTNIKIGLIIKLAGSYTTNLDFKIKNYIVDYVEKVNDTTTKNLALSNLMRGLEENFDDIQYVEFEHLDNTTDQIIKCNTTSINNLTQKQLINYVPEYLNIHIGSEAYIYGSDDFVTGITIKYT
jgi:hypothetical protein